MSRRANAEAVLASDLTWDYSASTPLMNNEDNTQVSSSRLYSDEQSLRLNQRQVLYLINNMDESGRVLRNAISSPSSVLSPPEWMGPRAADSESKPIATSVHIKRQHWGWKILSIEVCFAMILVLQLITIVAQLLQDAVDREEATLAMPTGILVVQLICCVIYFVSLGCSLRLLWCGTVSWVKALTSFLTQLFLFAGVNSLTMYLDGPSWTKSAALSGPKPEYALVFCVFLHDSICSSSFGRSPSTIPAKWYSLFSNSVQDVLSYGHFLWFIMCLVHRYHNGLTSLNPDSNMKPLSDHQFRPVSSSPVLVCSVADDERNSRTSEKRNGGTSDVPKSCTLDQQGQQGGPTSHEHNGCASDDDTLPLTRNAETPNR